MTDFDALEKRYGLPTGLLAAVQNQESGGNPDAVSPAGALGAFQFMPATAKQYGIDPLDPDQAAQGAARYLGDLSQKYNGDISKTLAAYNWGPGNVDKHGTDNLPTETRNYVDKITANLPTSGTATQTINQNLGPTSAADMMPADDFEVVDSGHQQSAHDNDDFEVVGNQGADQGSKKSTSLFDAVVNGLKMANPLGSELADLTTHPEKTLTALQGPSFGLSDEAQAGLAAPLIYGLKKAGNALGLTEDNPSLAQSYDYALKQARDPVKQEEKDHPLESAGLQLAASLPAGGLKLGGSLFQAVRNLRSVASEAGGGLEAADAAGNALKQIVTGVGKGVANGATAGAAYGFGSGEGSGLDRVQRAYSGAGLGSLVGGAGGAIPGLVQVGSGAGIKLASLPATISKSLAPLADDSGVITSQTARKLASQDYKTFSDAGGAFHPDLVDDWINDAQKVMPQSTEGKLFSGDDDAAKFIDRAVNGTDKAPSLQGKPLSFQGAQEIDEHLSDLIDNNTNLGKVNKTGYKLQQIQTALRDKINGATEDDLVSGSPDAVAALGRARQTWADSYKLNDIQRILDRASMSEQPATAIKSGFRTLLNNPNKTRGYSSDELDMMRQATKTGFTTGLVKLLGSRLIPIIEAAHGNLTGGAISYGVGSAARAAAEHLQGAPARNLQQAISDRILAARAQ